MSTSIAKPGQIITFYSYKGGTGRSMAVANLAYWLVKTFPDLTRRVLVMDWDLEAPGLHRYFAETAELLENKSRPGIINYFDAAQKRLQSDRTLCELLRGDEGWKTLAKELPLDEYVIKNVVEGVDFIKAGHYDAAYSELISTFNWVKFYQDFGGMFSAFRDLLLQSYDFCLVDSRTGFNDVSGICTMLLPEKLVTVFTPNRQNISGVLDLAGRAAQYRLGSSDPRTLSVFPLPSRIENAELDLKDSWQEDYQREFQAKFKSIYQLDTCDLTKYFDDVQLPHVSFYSYGEEIALLREERSGALSLSRAYELFFDKLISLSFAWEDDGLKEAPEFRHEEVPPNIQQAYDYSAIDHSYDTQIFVSYSHADNLTPSDEVGWVDMLQKGLETRLGQLLGRHIIVWRDPKLRGSDLLVDSIIYRLAETSVLLAIITPSYLTSEWCIRELLEFYRQAEKSGRTVSSGRSRIIKILKTPIDYMGGADDVWPALPAELRSLLSETLGYEFYQVTSDGRIREFSTDRTDKRFWERLDDLAYDIANFLKAETQTKGLPEITKDKSSGVYLAETTPDLESQRESIRRELQQHGYEVLPNAPLPREIGALREAVTKYLNQSRLSVHMVGDMYGPVPAGANRSVVEIQNEIAAQSSDLTSLKRIIWMPIGVLPHEERQSQLIQNFEVEPNFQIGADVVQTSLQDLKVLIHKKLTKETVAQSLGTQAGLVRIYFLFDQRDNHQIGAIKNYLFDLGYEVILPVFEGDPAELFQYHKDNLLLCDAVLIYFGNSNVQWLQSRLLDLRKALGWGRSRSFKAITILVAEPFTREKEEFRTLEAQVIKQFGTFNADLLQPFIDAIWRDNPESQRLKA